MSLTGMTEDTSPQIQNTTDKSGVYLPHRVFQKSSDTQTDSDVTNQASYQSNDSYTQEKTLISNRQNMLVSLVGVFFLLIQLVQFQDPKGVDLVALLDSLVCMTLMADFVYDFYYSHNRRQFLKQRWWEPLASIPLIDTGQKLALAVRFIRILRLLRFMKFHNEFRAYYNRGNSFLKKNKVLDISSLVLLTIMTGSLGFFYAEQGVNPNLHNFSDSLWWALVTVTTIGYGDIFPVTTAGRFIASLMMFIGIGCVSSLTGLIAANVIRDNQCPHCGKDI